MSQELLPISIVVPTFNRVAKLVRLLKSLDKLNPIASEVIIVDDNSTDGTRRILKKWQSIRRDYGKKIVLKDCRRGPAHSRNLGIQESIHDLIAFTDDDVVVDEKWIKYLYSKIANSIEKLAGVGGVVKALKKDILGQYYEEHKILEAPVHLNYLPSVNCCFKKAPLIEIGCFDAKFSFAGGEDTDLCLRLRNKGYFFQKEKKAIVLHDFSPKFLDFCKMWIRYGKGTQLAINKNKG